MLDRRRVLAGITAAPLLGGRAQLQAQPARISPLEHRLVDSSFEIDLDPVSGAVTSICHPADRAKMSWISNQDNAPWLPAGSQWGLGFSDVSEETLHRARWTQPVSRHHGDDDLTTTYSAGPLQIEVTRRLGGGTFQERYQFTNLGPKPARMRSAKPDAFAIYTPFNDHYTNSTDVMEHRAHTHVWAGGASSWVKQTRMGGRDPHLGLVLTEGSLGGYSIEDRDKVTYSNTRGTFLLHPDIGELAPGASAAVAWTLFWHRDWDDFFDQARRLSSQMVEVDSSRWVCFPGETAQLSFTGALGSNPNLKVDGQAVELRQAANTWRATVPAAALGERRAVLTYGSGRTCTAVLNTVTGLDDLLSARVRFITSRQHWHRPGDAWEGAYLTYDNQMDGIARHESDRDRNAGRERVGMGVLVARWLRQTGAVAPAVRSSLDRYYAFVVEKLQRPDGYVLDGVGSSLKRLYNWPWVMQLHLEMARLTDDPACWRRFTTTLESFYAEGGTEFYPIGLPILETLSTLNAAGQRAEYDRALAMFVEHGSTLASRGTAYPPHEVNFEQSIVAPATNILLELHAATGDPAWLRAARPHVALLELFEGRQPDHHLNGVAIRHWDAYWFGKYRMWGDTFPHYWSSLNALAWDLLASATGERRWQERSERVLRANLSLFTTDGRGSCAYIYPTTVDGREGRRSDPYANDQDWALVHALQLRERRQRAVPPRARLS